jgi:hypothetical protein
VINDETRPQWHPRIERAPRNVNSGGDGLRKKT